jgi:hypothetical protein
LADAWQSVTRPPVVAWWSVRDRLLRRKLARRNGGELTRALVASIVIRIVAAAECFVSMVLIAWVSALAGAISAGGWPAVKTVDEASLSAAQKLADSFAADLLPVLLVWAVLLLVAPVGFSDSVPAAAVLAGVVGYLHLVPPPLLFPSLLPRVSRALIVANTPVFQVNHRSANPAGVEVVCGVLIVALLLQLAARRRFRRLQDLGARWDPQPGNGVFSRRLTRKLVAMPLVALVFLLVIWAGTVIRLAASHGAAPASMVAYGTQGGIEQANYLLIVVVIAVLLSLVGNARLVTLVVLLALAFTLTPIAQEDTSRLRIALWSAQLARIGREWGTETPWVALFACVPLALLGMYLGGRLLARHEIRLY